MKKGQWEIPYSVRGVSFLLITLQFVSGILNATNDLHTERYLDGEVTCESNTWTREILSNLTQMRIKTSTLQNNILKKSYLWNVWEDYCCDTVFDNIVSQALQSWHVTQNRDSKINQEAQQESCAEETQDFILKYHYNKVVIHYWMHFPNTCIH